LIGVATILGVSMPSHNVVAIRNIATCQKLGITKVVVEINGVLHTNLGAPNTLLGP
jgi:hypothetical protein